VAMTRYRQRRRLSSVVRVLSPREGGGNMTTKCHPPKKDDFQGEDIGERGGRMAMWQQKIVAQTRRLSSVVRVLLLREGGNMTTKRCPPRKKDFRGEDVAE